MDKEEHLDRHAAQLAALGSTVRLSLLRIIVQGDAAGTVVGELQNALGIPWSTLSHHLERLTRAGLLKQRPDGKFIYYAADFQNLRALTNYVWEDCCKAGGSTCCD